MANCTPMHFFPDMTKRDIESLPDIHLYVCGFACQPYSPLRALNVQKHKENADDNRKTMVNHCHAVIESKKPNAFVFENVPTLMTVDKGQRFKDIINRLEKDNLYEVHHAVLNTADFDIPQSRRRLYIVGIRKDCIVSPFTFPKPLSPTRTLEHFLIDKTRYPFDPSKGSRRLLERIPADHDQKVYAIKWRGGEGLRVNAVPCITTSTDIYITQYNRNLTPQEKLLLQGFPTTFNNVVSESQLQKQAGNAMSVNVVQALFLEIFKTGAI
ncbi:Modification methylase Bsp6I [Gaertneriomyces sp. JEL0708]|nr:Modification methylase Bsp6I [Gaertneriomyces sp. JEL0708]